MAESVYIHIPFCKSKCKYCSFVSTTNVEDIELYINSLEKEIKNNYTLESLNTLYFGGGTPSLLKIQYIERLLKLFNIKQDTEVTFEINPDDADIQYLKLLKTIGINRLSFGAQTFDDEILKLIGRRHNSNSIYKAIDNSHLADFENVSIDLMYGLPFQNTDKLKKDVSIIQKLAIQHVSTYGLKIEQPSFFYTNPPHNLPDDDAQADMYVMINNILDEMEYYRYEISNFAKKGYESRHNLNYWNNFEYYGFGAAAHGYINGIRYSNSNNLKEYMDNPNKHSVEHKVTPKEQLEEEIFLGFRRETGINIVEINKKYNIDFIKKYENILNKYIPDYILPTETGYKLTLNGVLLSNNILSEFIDL